MFNRAKQFTEEKMGKAERTENDVVSSYNLKNGQIINFPILFAGWQFLDS